MVQTIELEEQDLERVDKLVKIGMFSSRQQAVKVGLESLLQLSEEDLKKMREAQNKVNGYCDSHLGNMLGAGLPLKVVVDSKDYFKISIKGEYEDKVYTYGYLFVDAETLDVDEELSDSIEKIHETAKQLIGHDKNTIV